MGQNRESVTLSHQAVARAGWRSSWIDRCCCAVIRGFVTEINCMGYEACYAAYEYGEPWRLELIKVRSC